MTLLNLINITVAAGLLVALILLYRRLRKKVEDADGMGDVNDRGEAGSTDNGDVIAALGDTDTKKND